MKVEYSSIGYVEKPYVFKTHIEVWCEGARIGSINNYDGLGMGDYTWDFLSYPWSKTSFQANTLEEIKNQINIHLDALITENQQD